MALSIVKSEPTKADAKTYDLHPRQVRAVSLLVSGLSNKKVAEEIGVTDWTVSQWLNNNQEFIRAVKNETESITALARRKLAATVVDAVDTLADTVKTGSGSANRTKAAITILDKAGIVGPAEGGLAAAGIDPQVAALANLIHARRAAEQLDKAEANEQ